MTLQCHTEEEEEEEDAEEGEMIKAGMAEDMAAVDMKVHGDKFLPGQADATLLFTNLWQVT